MGQLLIAGFNGQQIPAELRSMAREFSLGGVILFARNVVDPEQVAEISFNGGVMPQKSTDFYPKLLSGLTIYKVED